ncbi:MAG: hypothetical protein IJS66_04240 [Bacteroidales bacterium]|nr:hypothetical protein [Bacteroidales bacterium]
MSAIDRFVADTLSREGRRLLDRQTAEISMRVGRRSGTLLDSRRVSSSDSMLTLVHPAYERFIDMKVLGGHRHKRARIHNRFVYCTFGRIADQLMNGYADDFSDSVKK